MHACLPGAHDSARHRPEWMCPGEESVIMNSPLSLSALGAGRAQRGGCLTMNFVSGRGAGH